MVFPLVIIFQHNMTLETWTGKQLVFNQETELLCLYAFYLYNLETRKTDHTLQRFSSL